MSLFSKFRNKQGTPEESAPETPARAADTPAVPPPVEEPPAPAEEPPAGEPPVEEPPQRDPAPAEPPAEEPKGGFFGRLGFGGGSQKSQFLSIMDTPEEPPAPVEPAKPSLLDRLKFGIQKTRAGLVERIDDVVQGKKQIDADLLEELEYTLVSADIGIRTTTEILERIRQRVDRRLVNDSSQLKSLIKEHLLEVLQATDRAVVKPAQPPTVAMIVGVNGVGKTTTIGKLTQYYRNEGKSVLLCAADTFRAAAIEQLEVWGERTSTEVIRQKQGADPSAVLFDALQSAKSRRVDYVIVDTAGRLHTKANLMAELEKMRRTATRVIDDAPHEVLLVLDATTGQNGLEQARKFTESSGVTGIVLTKLDGTAKGGVVVAIARELNLPIRFVGVGEQVNDLLPFDPERFIDSLFD